MRRALVLAATGCALVGACADLFHDTDFAFVERVDASTLDGTVAEAAAAIPGDLCALPVAEAKALAIRSCALLSACQSPFGTNAAGACLSHAIPAMACKGAPGSAVRGPVLAFYRCLAAARNCSDIERCVFPVGAVPQCGSTPQAFTQCGLARDGQDSVRIDCRRPDAAAFGESCAAFGKICSVEGDVAGHCTGQGGLGACVRSGCDGSSLRLCRDGGAGAGRDDGFDCANVGAGSCVENDAGPACLPKGDVVCTPSAAVDCNVDGVAVGCPAGRQELVDCSSLFGSPCHPVRASDAGASLDAGPPRAWDVQRACEIGPEAGACAADSCAGKTLVACVRGSRIAIDCAALFGTECRSITTGDGIEPTCMPPQ